MDEFFTTHLLISVFLFYHFEFSYSLVGEFESFGFPDFGFLPVDFSPFPAFRALNFYKSEFFKAFFVDAVIDLSSG